MSDRKETNASLFNRWLSSHVSPGQISDFFLCYSEIEKHGYKIRLLKQPLLETTDLVLLSKLASEINNNKLFRFWHRKQINKMGLAMTLYISFIKETATQKPHRASFEADNQTAIEINDSSDHDSAFETKDTKRMDSDGSQKDAIGITIDAEASPTNDELHSIGEQSDESVPESATKCTVHQNEGLTIRGAVAKVLSSNEVHLTAQQIYDRIVSAGLYEFGAKDPVSVIRTEINRACKGSNYSQRVSNIIFGSQLNEDGEREYFLLARESELPIISSSSPMTIESNQESDARSCNSDESSNIPDSLTLADRLYLALSQECESNPFGTTAEYLAKVVAESAKDVKRILADVEWASYKYGKYTLVDSVANKELVYDYSKPKSLSFTKPICAVYFDEVVSSASTWRQLFIDVLRVLYDDYPSKIDSVVGQVFPSFVAPLIGTKEDAVMFRAPKEFVNGLFVEVNRSANDLISALIKLLDICDVDLENLVIKYEIKQTKIINSQKKSFVYSKKSSYEKESTSPVIIPITVSVSKEKEIIKESWKKTIDYLEKRYDVRLCYDYLSNSNEKRNDVLHKANNGKKDIIWLYYLHSSRNHYISIETEPEYLTSVQGELKGFTKIQMRESHPRQKMIFHNYEEIQNSLSDICDSIDSFFKGSSAEVSNELKTGLCFILGKYFQYGLRIDSIRELMRFRQYADQLNILLPENDDELKKAIEFSGSKIDDKVYCMSEGLPEELQTIVDNIFSSGTQVIYYDCILQQNSEWSTSNRITSEEMLKEYLQKYITGCSFSKRFFTKGQRKTEKEAVSAEVLRIWGNHQTLSIDEIDSRLPYIPKQKIWHVIASSDLFVIASEQTYLLVDRFLISDNEKKTIRQYVDAICNEKGFASITDIPLGEIEEKNYELQRTTIFIAIYRIVLSDDYYLNGKILTKDKPDLNVISLLEQFVSDKDECTLDELSEKVVELTGGQNRQSAFQALFNMMVRVDRNRFVANRFVDFDVKEIDDTLSHFVTDNFCSIRSITTFAMFPICGQSWNHYLLESFCYKYSKKYSLHVINFNDKNAGIIANKDYDNSYLEMLAIELVRSNIELTPENVAHYLYETGYMARRKSAKYDEIVQLAKKLKKER